MELHMFESQYKFLEVGFEVFSDHKFGITNITAIFESLKICSSQFRMMQFSIQN